MRMLKFIAKYLDVLLIAITWVVFVSIAFLTYEVVTIFLRMTFLLLLVVTSLFWRIQKLSLESNSSESSGTPDEARRRLSLSEKVNIGILIFTILYVIAFCIEVFIKIGAKP